jgi:glycosyl transferase, family 25
MWPIYVINLDRAPDRMAGIAAQLDALGIGWQRIAARDRLACDMDAAAREFGAAPGAGRFPATPGDICCSLTHRDIWRQVADGPAGGAVILEDDATLSPAFGALMAGDIGTLMARHRMGALKLEHWPGPQRSRRFPLGRRLGTVGAATLWRLRSSFYGSCGYAVTADAARTLLACWPAMAMPVDHLLFSRRAGRGFRLLRPGFLNPAPVLHDVGRWGSDIGGERAGTIPTGADRWPDRLSWLEERLTRAERVAMRFATDG